MTTPVATGAEFLVNTTTVGSQYFPSLTAFSGGGFVVTWTGPDEFAAGIYGQRYDAAGTVVGSEFQVNTSTSQYQRQSTVAALSNDGFVITWESQSGDGSGYGVFAQRYNADGTMAGSEFLVNSYTAAYQTDPSIVALSGGGFIITWTSNGQDGSSYGVYGQRYNADGTTAGSEFPINTYTAGGQGDSSVTALNGGSFVVTWTSSAQDGSNSGVYGQRYNANGTTAGSEFLINTHIANGQSAPSVTALNSGGFVVTWESYGQDSSLEGVYGQRYNAAGTATGSEFLINTYTTGIQRDVSVTALSDGGFVVTWSSNGQDGSGYGIYGQRYDANGNASGSEFLINTYTTSNQFLPTVTALSDGGFVVTWSSNGQDGSYYGVYAQSFSYASAVFTPGDDTVTLYGPGQSVDALGGADTVTGADYAAGSDTIFGNSGNDTLYGMAGNDILDGGIGNDTLNGGGGVDTASYANDTTGVTVNLTLATDQAIGGASGFDQLISIENVTGGSGLDTITGNNSDNVLSGGASFDNISGLDGHDTIVGGAGNDWLYGGDGNDTFLFNAGDGADEFLLDSSGTDRVLLGAGISISDVRFISGTFISDQDNLINVIGTGGDQMTLPDQLSGSAFMETLEFDNGTIWDLTAGLTFTGRNGASDEIHATPFDDIIYGLSGGDILVGKAGSDTLIGGDGSDNLFANVNTGGLGGDAGVVNYLWGGAGADILNGAEGDDLMVGGSGADQFYGGNGNDWIYMDGEDFTAELNGGAGLDRVFVNTVNPTFTLDVTAAEVEVVFGGDEIDILDATGSNSTVYLIGAGGNDIVTGGNAVDVLWGYGDNDTLSGNGSIDWLYAGIGADHLHGGAGDDFLIGGAGLGAGDGDLDTFYFADGSGVDRIYEFDDGIDKIDLTAKSGLTLFSQLTITAVDGGANAAISYGSDTIYVIGTTAAQLSAADFWL